MKRYSLFQIIFFSAPVALFSTTAQSYAVEPVNDQQTFYDSADWPWWRGPLRNGTASADQHPPTEWSATKNIKWRSEIAGRAYGSPIVIGNQVILAACVEDVGKQMLLSFDRASGKPLWQTTIHESGAMRKNEKSTGASSTPACDGKLVFINFANNDRLITSAVDLQGKVQWEYEVSHYVEHQGYGASPAIYQDLVIVSSDNKAGGAIVALKRETGEVVWKRERPEKPNYPGPALLHVSGKDQLLMVGCDMVVSYDPLTGNTNWETEGATTECVTSTLTDGELIFTSGGYPKNHVSAIAADGSAKIVWENDKRVYVPSMVIRDGYLYAMLDAGIATCWQASTGKEMWKERVGGTFSSSLVLVGDRVYATNEAGETTIFKASPDGFEKVAQNQLGFDVFSTPAIVGGKIYQRVAMEGAEGKRQEYLVCIGD